MLHVCVSIIRYNASDIKTNAHSNSQKEINESKKASGGQEKKKLNQIQWMAIIIHPKRSKRPGKARHQ